MLDSPGEPETRRAPGTPRWVKVLGIAGVVAVLLVIGAMLLSGGQHGPGRHAPATDSGIATPPPSGAATSGAAGGPADASGAARTIEVALECACHEAGHFEAGARGRITLS